MSVNCVDLYIDTSHIPKEITLTKRFRILLMLFSRCFGPIKLYAIRGLFNDLECYYTDLGSVAGNDLVFNNVFLQPNKSLTIELIVRKISQSDEILINPTIEYSTGRHFVQQEIKPIAIKVKISRAVRDIQLGVKESYDTTLLARPRTTAMPIERRKMITEEALKETALVYKIIITGARGTGKTTLHTIIRQNPIPKYSAAEFSVLKIKPPSQYDFMPQLLCLQAWTYTPESKFSSMFISGAKGAIVLFDMTRRETLEIVPEIVGDIVKHAGYIPILIVGNKIDMCLQQRCISDDEVTEIIEIIKREFNYDDEKIKYTKMSANNGLYVDKVFRTILRMIIEHDKLKYMNRQIFSQRRI